MPDELRPYNGTNRPDPSVLVTEAIDRAVKGLEDKMEAQLKHCDAAVMNLKELSDSKFVTQKTMLDAQGQQVAIALEASEKAIIKAEAAIEKQFEAARRELEEIGKQVAELRSRLDIGPAGLSALERQYSNSQGIRQGSVDARSLTFVVIGVLVGVVGLAARFLGN